MTEAAVSEFIKTLLSEAFKSVSLSLGGEFDAEIEKLQRTLYQIQDVLTDAFQREVTNQSVKRWLNDLQRLAYDIDDVLDDFTTERMHREFTSQSEAITSNVRKLIPVCCTTLSWSARMRRKLDDNNLTAKALDLLKEKDIIGLSVEEDSNSKYINRVLPESSVVHEPSIVGRQAEKEALMHKLLAYEPFDQNFSILPIVGMGGIGKTTLARVLYNDRQVKDHFELKAWVCVSNEFDSFIISKLIFQQVAGEIMEVQDINVLQVALRDYIRERRFLIVLDDVWSENLSDWENLLVPLYACAPGSKIIMTTRKVKLLKKLGYSNINQLRTLSHDDAMSLVALHALGVDNFDSHLSLKPHGVDIVKKCDGLPLALIAIARLLRIKGDKAERWEEVLYSETWRLEVEDAIIPRLRRSYHDLSAHLKKLFTYCSLFPKGYMFDKEQLVQLWMAEGLLYQSTQSDSTEESLGHDFDELLSMSFFQHAPNNKSLFVMHDMINDLATFLASEFFLRWEKNTKNEALEKYRHLSFVHEEYVAYEKFEPFEKARNLRTFLAMPVGAVESSQSFYLSNNILAYSLRQLLLLRALCLRDFKISEVPESIGNLKHLRYLNLSRTGITHLPANVCNLYNLQTLILFGCYRLAKLPHNFSKLKNMRHLDIRDTPLLHKIPLGIGELKNLVTLSKVIIGGESKFSITKLKYLKNLCGKISIVGLDKVQNAAHARQANLSEKRLSELELVWSDVLEDPQTEVLEKEILSELKPHYGYLKQLEIVSYGGLEFPDWVGHHSFLHLKHVSIRCCKKCSYLPPLGQLPSLKELFIEGLDRVEVVGMALLGTSLAFRSLEVLSFKHMPGWEKWSNSSGIVFPCLQQLLLRDCPNLVEVSIEALPSLNVLEIFGCNSGVLRTLVEVASSVTRLDITFISGLNDVVWRGVTEYLGAVEELSMRWCDGIRYVWESEAAASKVLVSLRKLMVECCGNLVSLGEKEEEEEEDNCRSKLLTSFRTLYVSHCDHMVRCICPDSIETLSVSYSTSIAVISLPVGGQKLKSLDISNCNMLLERQWGGRKINNKSNMPMLEDVDISDWPNLRSIINLNYFVHLTSLSIRNCESLVSFPDNELSSLTSLKHLGISNCPSIDARFPRGIWPPKLHSLTIGKLKKPISEWGPQNFPTSLVVLRVCGDDVVSSCSKFSHLLPLSLTSLEITEFEKLESFSMGLQHLTSLQHLSVYNCPNLMDLPEVLLPSLLSLVIWECPNLKGRCLRSDYYRPISRIPCVRMDP